MIYLDIWNRRNLQEFSYLTIAHLCYLFLQANFIYKSLCRPTPTSITFLWLKWPNRRLFIFEMNLFQCYIENTRGEFFKLMIGKLCNWIQVRKNYAYLWDARKRFGCLELRPFFQRYFFRLLLKMNSEIIMTR